MRAFATILVLAAICTTDAAAQLEPPTPDSLAAISERGIMLARYDYAAWHATDAVVALNPGPEEIRGYIALQHGGSWVVNFGRMSDDNQFFLVAYEARQNTARPDSFSVVHHAPARRDAADLSRAARALDLARADFGTPSRSYNAAVLPASGGEWFVYLTPAQVHPAVFPIGGDVRYRVSPDGRSILTKRRLHNTIVDFGDPRKPGAALKAGFRTAVLDNVPEDTDVFHVLVRQPKVPDYLATDEFMYRVEPTGQILLMGRTKDVMGRSPGAAAVIR